MKKHLLSAVQIAALKKHFERCKNQILALDWVTQGSLSQSPQGNWRWTRKVKAKTVTVALSDQQAELFRQAIDDHRQLEKLIDFANMTTKFAKSDPGVALAQVIRQAERAVAPLDGDHFPRFFPYRRDCPDNFRPLEAQSFFFPDSSLFPAITIEFLQHRHDKFFRPVQH